MLLSSLFNISIDELVKEDIKEMKESIDKSVICGIQKLSVASTIGFIVMLGSVAPLVFFFEWIGVLIWTVIVLVAFIPTIKLDKLKKDNDIQTYKEIVAFINGKKFDEIQKATEKGKKLSKSILHIDMCNYRFLSCVFNVKADCGIRIFYQEISILFFVYLPFL